jgi:ribosomal protein S27AE
MRMDDNTKVIKCEECGDVFMALGEHAAIRLAHPRPITLPEIKGRKCPKCRD